MSLMRTPIIGFWVYLNPGWAHMRPFIITTKVLIWSKVTFWGAFWRRHHSVLSGRELIGTEVKKEKKNSDTSQGWEKLRQIQWDHSLKEFLIMHKSPGQHGTPPLLSWTHHNTELYHSPFHPFHFKCCCIGSAKAEMALHSIHSQSPMLWLCVRAQRGQGWLHSKVTDSEHGTLLLLFLLSQRQSSLWKPTSDKQQIAGASCGKEPEDVSFLTTRTMQQRKQSTGICFSCKNAKNAVKDGDSR
jgi:hypothetical protein